MKKVICQLVMMSVMLLSSQTVSADALYKSTYYTGKAYADHFNVNLLVADLYGRDSWLTSGYVKAYDITNPFRSVTLASVYTWDQDGNSLNTHMVKARSQMDGAIVILKNVFGNQIMLGSEEQSYMITKTSGNLDHPSVDMDIYWGPEMAGRVWTIKFECKGDNDVSHEWTLCTVDCRTSMNRQALNAKGYEIKRTNAKTYSFTTPKLPENNSPQEFVKAGHLHLAWYIVKATYILSDDGRTQYSTRDSIECTPAGLAKSINMPKNVGNFRRVDMEIEAHDVYKCNIGPYKNVRGKGEYYHRKTIFNRPNIFARVPDPGSVSASFDQFKKTVTVHWTGISHSTYDNYIASTKPYIYRIKTDKDGHPVSGESWTYRGYLNKNVSNTSMVFTDNGLMEYNQYYKYRVVNIPDSWLETVTPEALSKEMLEQMGYCEMQNCIETKPSVTVYMPQQDSKELYEVKLNWAYSRIPEGTEPVFTVWRADKDQDNWTALSPTVTPDLNPAPGQTASFVDNSAASNRVRYRYKVVLDLLKKANTFESDAVESGLLSGTTIQSLNCSKGSHDKGVVLQWNVKQSGSDKTNFDIYRRISAEDTDNDKWQQIHTTSGTADHYTYNDNTAIPGFFYDYMVKAYSGSREGLAEDEDYRTSTKTDIGYCQTTGIITGRLSYAKGNSAVSDARITMNATDGFSKQVGGPSLGITWEVDSATTSKIFSKANTVQMFVRPESSMTKGVLASVPGAGHFVLEKDPADERFFRLRMKSEYANKYLEENCLTETALVRVVLCMDQYGKHEASQVSLDGVDFTLYNYEDVVEDEYWDFVKQWKADGFNEIYRMHLSRWEGLNFIYFIKRVPIAADDYSYERSERRLFGREKYDLGIKIPANEYTQLTLMKDTSGHLTVKAGEQTSTSKTSVGIEEAYEVSPEAYAMQHAPFEVDAASLVSKETLLNEHFSVYSLYWDDFDELIMKTTKKRLVPYGSNSYDNYWLPFTVGGSYDVSDETGFHGNLSEVRVWDHVLSAKEEADNNDRILSGYEKGLQLYWPLNETVGHLAFDASLTNDYPNSRHATVNTNIRQSTLIPTTSQLSRYAVTNGNGDYILRGIPFVGSGTSYTLTPTKGTHVFEPQSRMAFISANSLTQNNYDFSDVSSFKVSGQVFYENTNIPVDSVSFKVDGEEVQGKHGIIYTDNDGKYEISVPQGNHRIEAYRNGHKLSSFPENAKDVYNFDKNEVVNFFDYTLVNITGRINSGFADKDEPLGFGRSVNRIGQAVLKLSLGREANSSFNYVVNDQGEGSFGTTPINVTSATPNIASTAYRGAGTETDNTNTHFIYITTDAKTGEFSAMLPPLNYMVESIRFPKDEEGDKAHYNNLPFFTQNLPMIYASNAIESRMLADTLKADNEKTVYRYAAKFMRQLRNNVEITVNQIGTRDKDVFGEEVVTVTNKDNTQESVNVVNYSGNSFSYAFDYPVFRQDELYNLSIQIKESNYNVDTKETVDEIPTDARIIIFNEASTSTSVLAAKDSVNGDVFNVSEAYGVRNIMVKPDESGKAEYSFRAGYPNVNAEHLRNLEISANVGGRTVIWHAPNKKDPTKNSLEMVVLGAVLTGKNFVTTAPDHVDMILRRPPGSTSQATLTTDSVYNISQGFKNSHVKGFSTGNYFSMGPSFKTKFLGYEQDWNIKIDNTTNDNNVRDTLKTTTEARSYEVKESMKTPNGGTFTQKDGDTYIGRSANLTMGQGDEIGIFKQDNGQFKIDMQPAICIGREFTTTFVYSQAYIEQTLIPNWRKTIESKLIVVENPMDSTQAVKVKGEVRYYTKLKKDDPRFGLDNADDAFTDEERDAAKGRPSYVMVDDRPTLRREDGSIELKDTIEYCAKQIYGWKQWIAKNEEDKLAAFGMQSYFDKNYSVAGGTSVSHTSVNTVKKGAQYDFTFSNVISQDMHGGLLINNVGDYFIVGTNNKIGQSNSADTTTTMTKGIDWTISDAEPTTALSVDVYQSPVKWGPIFRTRGGQTSNPYEGATYTKYYMTGAQLDEATMRVEKPEMHLLSDSKVTNIPSGSTAQFKLQLSNASETNTTCEYVLECKDGSNPNGAILMMDGTQLSNGKDGRKFKLKGGETIEKMLMVSQGDRTINDYENLKLVFKSAKDTSTVSQPALISVHFIPASTPIEMAVSHTTVNSQDYAEHKGLVVTLSNLDRTDAGLKGVRVRYRRKGYSSWTIAKAWQQVKSGETPMEGSVPLPASNPFTTVVAFPEDGVFELQAQTFGMYGAQELTYETAIVEITQDIKGPKVIGSTSPIGTINFINRNDIHVSFNEPINVNALSQSDNFTITGDLNNTAFNGDKTTNPDVALQLEGNEISTQASFLFDNSDLAMDMWLYRQADGNIVSVGTDANQLALYTENGFAKVRVGGTTADHIVTSDVQLPADKWIYLALSYKHDPVIDKGMLNAIYADADHDRPIDILKEVVTNDIDMRGKLTIGGNQMKGRMRDLTLWNDTHDVQQLYNDREKSKAAYMPGLVGYWRMNKGYGKTVEDKAHARDLVMATESWYINNDNHAARLDANDSLDITISSFAPQTTDNYALELWFRADEQDGNSNASLMELPNYLRIGFKDSKLAVKSCQRVIDERGVETFDVKLDNELLSDQKLIDNNWHHLALNVRRGSSAVAYIDGTAVKTLPESSIPALAGSNLYVGKGFSGSIDEVRIWNAALESKNIADRRYERLDSTYAGLIGYFPFESIHRTKSGTVTTEFTIYNFGDKNVSKLTASGIDKEHNLSASAPALLPISQRMRLDATEYNFTASERDIYFSLPDDILPRMDGSDYTFRVANVKDLSGNVSEPVEWTLHCDFSTLSLTIAEDEISKPRDEKRTFTAYLQSMSNTEESYEFINLPKWLTVSEQIGTVGASGKTLTFTIAANVPIGRYTTYLYVKDRLNVIRSQRLNLIVMGDAPNWEVDESYYNSTMTMTGQIYVGNKILEYEDSKIGAFDLWGNCIGVAYPEYIPTRDAYYVSMVIYGNPIEKPDPHASYEYEHKVIFQLYDSSTGIIYPLADCQLPGGEMMSSIEFQDNASYGSYDKPVIFVSSELVQQRHELNKGWNWMSLYLKSADGQTWDISSVFDKGILPYIEEVKEHNYFAKPNKNRDLLIGSLENIEVGKMYKVRMNEGYSFSRIGLLIDLDNTPQTIEPEWNWIGSLARYVMSPDRAFAELNPEKGDMVKNRTSFAEYNGYTWEGKLQEIKPGEGYLYHSRATHAKSFHYPKQVMSASPAMRRALANDEWHWTVENINHYPDNMTILATLEKDDLQIVDAEVAAFIEGECRGTIKGKDGHYFLTVLGVSAEDTHKPITLKAWMDGKEYDIDDMGFYFTSDTSYGSFVDGLVKLTIGGGTGINSITADDNHADWYDLQGRKLNGKPTKKGVFIKNRNKEVVK